HCPHARRPRPPPAGGPVGGGGGRLPVAPRRHGGSGRRRRSVQRRPHAGDARLPRPRPDLDRGRPVRGPGERPRRPRRHLLGDVGVPQRHPQRPARDGGPGRGHRPPPPVLLRQGAGRHPLRPGRFHHEPRRRLALPRPRPQPGTGGHDRPHALGRAPGRRRGRRLGRNPAPLLGPRGLPAHLPPGVHARPGHRVPPPRPPLPPLRHPCPGRGRDPPGRAPTQRGPGRARRRGPPHRGPGPNRPRVPPPAGAGGRPPRPPPVTADGVPRGRRRRGPALLPPGGAPRVEPARLMTWRIAITHTTGYRYRRQVTSSYNEARITPISSDRQLVLESSVAVNPSAVAFRYWDYWGTLVHAFDIQVPHIELSVTGTSVVETSGRPDPPDDPVSWHDLTQPDLRDRFAELLAPTTHVPLDDDVRAAAEPFLQESTPAAACE